MDERGDIVLNGLLRIVVGLVLSSLLLFEGGAVVVNRLHVEGAAQSAARAGAQAMQTHRDESRVEEAARSSTAKLSGAVVRELSVEPGGVVVTVSRRPPVLLIDRLGFLDGRLDADATARASLEIGGH